MKGILETNNIIQTKIRKDMKEKRSQEMKRKKIEDNGLLNRNEKE